MKKVYLLLILFSSASLSAQMSPSDPNATQEATALFNYLNSSKEDQLLFGHHNSNIFGKDWNAKKNNQYTSDVYKAVKDYPAIFSFDFNIGYDIVNDAVINAYKKGGIITISWHLKNLSNGESFYDTTGNVMERILPGGDLHKNYLKELNKVATFAKHLKLNGVQIPFIFRPFHENTGSWFWWGKNHCTAATYKQVFQFTVNYLRKEKKLHNILYAYSPSKPSQLVDETYESRYPGDNYIDIIGFDHYGSDNFSQQLLEDCRLVVEFAERHHKIAAITETGVKQGIKNTTMPNWYTEVLLNPILNDPIAKRVAYVVTWTNSKKTFWVPTPGDIYYDDFVKFYNHPFTIFASQLNLNPSK